MIIIISDSIDPWLVYIWEQFAKINLLQSRYQILTYPLHLTTKNKEDNLVIIEYSTNQRYPKSLFIPRINKFKTDQYTWIRNDLPVFSDTLINKNGIKNHDIFYNAFVHLSRLEEWLSEKSGNPIRSYSFRHPRKDKRVWKQPVVNLFFNELEKKIKIKCPQISFGPKKRPIIEFSHDVDYLYKTVQLRIKQTAFHLYNSFKLILNNEIVKALAQISKGINFALTNSDYWCFDYWADIEKKLGVNSVFYVYAKTMKGTCYKAKQWLIDPSYDIHSNKGLIEKCKELLSNGHKIGLHGSFYSAVDERLFKYEKEALEDAIDCEIKKNRQHWLNYSEIHTPYIHEKGGIKEDSTLGYNDISGFRSGIASAYNPYDHLNQKPFPFVEIPFLLMDSHIHHYAADLNDTSFEWIFKHMKNIKKFEISVDWHQRSSSPDYQWNDSYKLLVKKYNSFQLH